jgi:hypothetical protein
VSFFPDVTRTSQGNRIFDVTFSGASGTPGLGFDGLNPNGTWGLVLWDHSTSGIENGLVSWTLSITAVPEPVTLALGWFAGVFIGVVVIRQISIKKRPQQASGMEPPAKHSEQFMRTSKEIGHRNPKAGGRKTPIG